MIDNTIIKYNGKIFHNEEELKNFLNVFNYFLNHINSPFINKIPPKFTT